MQQSIEIIDSREKKITDLEVLETQLPLDDLDALNIQIQALRCAKSYCETDYDSSSGGGGGN